MLSNDIFHPNQKNIWWNMKIFIFFPRNLKACFEWLPRKILQKSVKNLIKESAFEKQSSCHECNRNRNWGKEIRIPFPGPFRAGQKSVFESRLQIRKRQEIYLCFVFGTQYLLNAGKYIFNVGWCKAVLFSAILQVVISFGCMLIL